MLICSRMEFEKSKRGKQQVFIKRGKITIEAGDKGRSLERNETVKNQAKCLGGFGVDTLQQIACTHVFNGTKFQMENTGSNVLSGSSLISELQLFCR